jgi:outer membrane immunogenic protein
MRWAVGATLALLTSLADAAELPFPEVYQRPAVVIFRWTGFYAGVHGGGGGGSKSESPLPFTFGNSFPISQPGLPQAFSAGASLVTPLPFDVGVSGWLAGGQVGANYQIENVVIGIEAQVSGANLTGSHTCLNTVTVLNVVAATDSASCSAKVNALGTLAARLGYAFDRFLVYGKFGGAFSNDHYNNTVGTLQGTAVTGGTLQVLAVGTLNFAANEIRWGWMLGAGAEYAFTDNWSAKIEYNYIGSGTRSLRFSEPTGISQMDADIREQIHLVKAGINYRFGVNTIVVR